MSREPKETAPPFCPRPECVFHSQTTGWRFKKHGFYRRSTPPYRVRRYRCLSCRVNFSDQAFQVTYWLKRPDLFEKLFFRLLGCSAYRQIAREFGVSHTTVMRQTERLARHCLLFQQQFRPLAPLAEPLVFDGFETFEYSQYFPCHFNLAAGAHSHFFYVFTDAPIRRKGRMTAYQKRRRQQLETQLGRPDPKAIEKETTELLRLIPRTRDRLELRSDEHTAYPRAIRRLLRDRPLEVEHQVTPSQQARTPDNPLFPVNLLDNLIRHSSSNHKRETIAFSKRRQNAAEKLAIFQVWRNFVKSFSEKRRDPSPAQRLGLLARRLSVPQLLAHRLFPSRIVLPTRLQIYYRRLTWTRAIPNGRRHQLKYAF